MSAKVLVVFYSRTGNVAKLADGIAEGAASAGAEVRTVRLTDLAPEAVIENNAAWKASRDVLASKYEEAQTSDLEWADAIVFGSPTRFGVMAAEMKYLFDRLSGLWLQGKLVNKVGGAFTSTSTAHGGKEATLLSLMTPMMHLGMILVPPGYTDPVMFASGSPYGATATVGGMSDQPPTEADLAVARHQGHRIAQIAAQLKAGAEA